MNDCLLYAEPELYDLMFPGARESAALDDETRRKRIVASEKFYLDEATRGGGPVLEMACGSGRLTIPLAKSGIEIVGADISGAMLAAARTKAAKAHLDVQFIQADMRSFDFPERFSTILIPGNSLLHLLTAEDLKQCLFSVRRNLATGGRLAFDISKWDLGVIGREAGIRYPVLTLRHPTRGIVTVEESAHYNAATQIRHVTWYLSAHGAPDYSVTHYDLRVIFPEELLLLLDIAGFRLEARYGEFSRVPFDEASPRQVCVATI